MNSHAHHCENCSERWDCDGKPGPVCTDVTCPICGFHENEPVWDPLTPEGPSAVFAYDWPGVGLFYRVLGGPLHGSDVMAETLRERGIKVPALSPAEAMRVHLDTFGREGRF